MVWHVMVYFDSVSLCYCYPYAVHFFLAEKPEPEDVIERARDILRNTFPNFVVAEEKKGDYGFQFYSRSSRFSK